MNALIWAFSSVTSDMALQFTQFNTCIVAFSAFMWFFMRMNVPCMSYQLPRSCECAIAVFTFVWLKLNVIRYFLQVIVSIVIRKNCEQCLSTHFDTSMRVYVVVKRSDCFESSFTNIAFMWPKKNHIENMKGF